jgi:hypothetical protein
MPGGKGKGRHCVQTIEKENEKKNLQQRWCEQNDRNGTASLPERSFYHEASFACCWKGQKNKKQAERIKKKIIRAKDRRKRERKNKRLPSALGFWHQMEVFGEGEFHMCWSFDFCKRRKNNNRTM